MSPTDPPRRTLTGAIVPALATAALAGLLALYVVGRAAPVADGSATPPGCITDQLQRFGGPISLQDVNGAAVTQADFRSGPSILYFGFTHCPDVCPTTLYAMAQALSAPGGYDIQPIFISVDPRRDTAEVLRQYVATSGFPTGLVGLTGTPEQIRQAADGFHVSYQADPATDGDAANYNVSHTSLLYVMDAQWQAKAVMSTVGATPQTIAACIGAALSAH